MMSDETTALLPSAQRSLTPATRRLVFALCIFCCLSGASITLIALYTPALLSAGYTATQINAIAIAGEVGMYFSAPFIGYIGDQHGHSKLAVLSGCLLVPGYLMASYIFYTEGRYELLAICFTLIGIGTTAFYVFAFVTCAHLYPNRSGLAISAPVAAFGISSLWQSQLIPWLFRAKELSIAMLSASLAPVVIIDCTKAFLFFACFYAVCAGIGVFAVRLAGGDDRRSSLASEDKLVILRTFVSKKETWILMATFVLTAGPLETYLNNMGAIVGTTRLDQAPSSHVAFFSCFSTVARLFIGALSDAIRYKVSTATVVSVILATTGVSHILLALGSFTNPSFYYILSGLNGFSYGALFTLYPTMVALVWGIESFASHWGLFILGPAVGSVVYGLLFGKVYESHSDLSGACFGNHCYEITFLTMGSGILVAASLVLALWKYSWLKEGIAL